MGLEFVNITREEFLSKKLLHKYMPLEYALDSLNNRHLWFANPATWKDPFEKNLSMPNLPIKQRQKLNSLGIIEFFVFA